MEILFYPEISDGNFKGAFWTFKQWLALNNGMSIVLILTSLYKAFSGYKCQFLWKSPA